MFMNPNSLRALFTFNSRPLWFKLKCEHEHSNIHNSLLFTISMHNQLQSTYILSPTRISTRHQNIRSSRDSPPGPMKINNSTITGNVCLPLTTKKKGSVFENISWGWSNRLATITFKKEFQFKLILSLYLTSTLTKRTVDFNKRRKKICRYFKYR